MEKRHSRLPGSSGKSVTDLPETIPTTSLAVCACLRKGNVAICVQVAEVTQRPNAELPEKSMCKAYVQQVDQKGTLYQAELWDGRHKPVSKCRSCRVVKCMRSCLEASWQQTPSLDLAFAGATERLGQRAITPQLPRAALWPAREKRYKFHCGKNAERKLQSHSSASVCDHFNALDPREGGPGSHTE